MATVFNHQYLNTVEQHDAQTMVWFWSGLCCHTQISR